MRKLIITAALVAGLVLAAPAMANATTVSIGSWHVYTKDHKLHKVKPGKSFRACASDPAVEIDAKGKVKSAKKGKPFKELWSIGGHRDSSFDESWSKSGSFSDYFGLVANDGSLKNGKWKLKVVQGGKTIGHSSVTIRTKAGC